jgi:hypothetical protein
MQNSKDVAPHGKISALAFCGVSNPARRQPKQLAAAGISSSSKFKLANAGPSDS